MTLQEQLNALDWSQFSFSDYFAYEQRVLKPQLERQGFTSVRFGHGEYDSFGPLSRMVRAVNKHGQIEEACYG